MDGGWPCRKKEMLQIDLYWFSTCILSNICHNIMLLVKCLWIDKGYINIMNSVLISCLERLICYCNVRVMTPYWAKLKEYPACFMSQNNVVLLLLTVYLCWLPEREREKNRERENKRGWEGVNFILINSPLLPVIFILTIPCFYFGLIPVQSGN